VPNSNSRSARATSAASSVLLRVATRSRRGILSRTDIQNTTLEPPLSSLQRKRFSGMSGKPHDCGMSIGIQPTFSRGMSSPAQACVMSCVSAANVLWDLMSEGAPATARIGEVIRNFPEADFWTVYFPLEGKFGDYPREPSLFPPAMRRPEATLGAELNGCAKVPRRSQRDRASPYLTNVEARLRKG
jgi:hypothetical protein